MKKRSLETMKLKEQRGVVAILVGFMMFVLVGIGALAIDIGYLMGAKNELQNIADAAALAAARKLGDIYKQDGTYDSASQHPNDILSTAQEVAVQNAAAGKNDIILAAEDIQIGVWDWDNQTLDTAIGDPPNAVKVIARRDADANGPVLTFFARIFGIDTVDLSAVATAALGSKGLDNTGDLLPIGISQALFPCGAGDIPIHIRFTEDCSDCAGWHTFTDSPDDSDIAIREIINGMLPEVLREDEYSQVEAFSSPDTGVDDEFVFTKTPVTDSFNAVKTLYEDNRDASGDWTVSMVVYQHDSCGNVSPEGFQTGRVIAGFATVIINNVCDMADDAGGCASWDANTLYDTLCSKKITGTVLCNVIDDYRAGGEDYGTMGTIPSLVQ